MNATLEVVDPENGTMEYVVYTVFDDRMGKHIGRIVGHPGEQTGQTAQDAFWAVLRVLATNKLLARGRRSRVKQIDSELT